MFVCRIPITFTDVDELRYFSLVSCQLFFFPMIIFMFFSGLPSVLPHVFLTVCIGVTHSISAAARHDFVPQIILSVHSSLLSDHVQVIVGLFPATAAHGTDV